MDKKELFEKARISTALITIAAPTVISQLIDIIYNLADTWFIGRTGDPYMIAGASIIASLYAIVIPLGNVFGIGGGSLIAGMMGNGRNEKIPGVSSFCFYGGIAVSFLFSLLVLIFMEPLFDLLGVSADTWLYARQYTVTVVILGGPFMITSSVQAHLLRNTGYSKQAGYGLSAGGILNLLLDPLFMFVLFPDGMEVLAAGCATLLSNILTFFYMTILMLKLRHSSGLSLSPRMLTLIGRREISRVLAVGIPSGVLTTLIIISHMTTNMLMASYGDLQLAAIGIVLKLERIPNAIGVGICQGMMPLVAYNFAARNDERMQETMACTRKLGAISGLCFVALYATLAPQLVSFFLSGSGGDIQTTLDLAGTFLRLRCALPVLMFFNYYSSFSMQALGDGRTTLLHAAIRILGLNLPLMFALKLLLQETGVALAFPISEIASDIIALLLLQGSIRRAKRQRDDGGRYS